MGCTVDVKNGAPLPWYVENNAINSSSQSRQLDQRDEHRCVGEMDGLQIATALRENIIFQAFANESIIFGFKLNGRTFVSHVRRPRVHVACHIYLTATHVLYHTDHHERWNRVT